MKITVDKTFRADLLKRIADREFSERTGIHITDIIFCLNKQGLRRLHPQPNSDGQLLLFSLGWSTQRWLTGQDKDLPEKEVDGIKVTLDALAGEHVVGEKSPASFAQAGYAPSMTVHKGIPWELKASFQSNTKPIEDNLHWVRQVMAQCYVTGTTTAYLTRLEIMGNWKWVYKPSKPEKIAELVAQFGEHWDEHPTLTAVRLEFDQKELDDFWAWAKHRRDQFKSVLDTGKLLPKAEAIASGMSFECDACAYRAECEAKCS